MIKKKEHEFWDDFIEFSDLKGETLIKVVVNDDRDEIHFHTQDGQVIRMYHEQDCCESVSIEDICGDIDDLLGVVTLAEESTNEGSSHYGESETWTFYRLHTDRGGVTIRWYGASNGYYSESVSLELL